MHNNIYIKMSKVLSKKNPSIEIARIEQMIHKLPKFYLVGITGRTSFILQNINGTKFKITIGNELKCSCNAGNGQQCMHTLYALLEIFYIPTANQLLFTNKYNDKDLRYIIANRRIHDNKVSDFMKYVKANLSKKSIIIEEEDQDDDEDNICAICQTQIVRSDAVTSCATECKNIFHLDCFSQWANHQLKNSGIVKCPLCRDEKPPEIIYHIKQKEYELKEQIINKKIGKEFNYYCDECQLKQIGPNQAVYKCVHCEDVTLCETCFKLGRHMRHSFICKLVSEKKWRECEDRKIKKKTDTQQGLIKIKLKNSKRLTNFLASTLPCYFSKNTRWNITQCKKLDIKVEQLECIACKDKQKAFLRKMLCGHFIHHRCLRKRIEKGRFYCKIDGQKYLLGYEALLKHEELNKKTEEITEKQQSESEQEEKEERKSPIKSGKSSKYLRSETSTTSCDSRKKKKNKHSIEQRNNSLTSKFYLNPQ